jgi:hypothetical protein
VLRRLIRLALVGVLLAAVCGVMAAYLPFDRRPAVDRAAEFTPDHIERAKQILSSNDPRRLRTGAVRTVAVSAADADLALNYLVNRYAHGSAEARFAPARLHVRISMPVSAPALRAYINVDVSLVEGARFPRIERCRIGRLPVPPGLAHAGFDRWVTDRWSRDEIAVVRQAIRKVEFAPDGARLTYRWDDALVDTVRAALLPADARERLRVYQHALADATRGLPAGEVSLAALLTPVFRVALERGAASDPVLENRAAILVLTFYVDGRSLGEVVPDARSWPRAARRAVTLDGRGDLPRHFMISAALSANTGGPFADAVGVYKEVADSRGGSGFSFVDIAADRAGSRLGELGEGRASARTTQERLSVPLTERVLMPATGDLPEFMPEAEFKRRFGGVGAPTYVRMIAEIDARIAALPLYR